MNDLQLTLLALGIVVILGMIAFNWWQERKFRNETNRRFGSPSDDVLLNDEFDFDAAVIFKQETQPKKPAPAENVLEETAFITRTEPAEDALVLHPNPEDEIPEHESGSLESIIQHNSMADSSVDDDEEPSTQFAAGLEGASDQKPFQAPAQSQLQVASEEALAHTDHVPLLTVERAPVVLSSDTDLLVDLVALLEFSEAISAISLHEFMTAVADIDKPKGLYGLDAEGVWHLIDAAYDGLSFSKVTCRLQLADRAGFVSQNMLNHFQHEVKRLAAALGAELTWQPEGDAWQRANALDQFCIDVDQMVGFHLTQGGNGPFTGTKFRGLAEANGLALDADGAFHSMSEEGLCQFSVINRDNNPFSIEMLRTSVIYGITFQLDIPRVKHCLETFNHMVLTARQMEKSLGANLVDDNQRLLGETQIERIRQQLKVIQAKMLTRGIVPGSPTALRLFS